MLRARIGQVAVHVDVSWFATLAIIAGGFAWLARSLLPETGWIAAGLLGAAAGVALTGSLLAHELAHAYAARGAGIQIEHVRIFAGGALSRRRQETATPTEQFRVAVAGPLSSLAIGTCALLTLLVLQYAGVTRATRLALCFIAFANVLIAASNMLPVFPFDGAKLIHAHFWRRSGDRRLASVRLERGGREFSRTIVLLGILVIALSGDILVGMVIAGLGVYLLRMPVPP